MSQEPVVQTESQQSNNNQIIGTLQQVQKSVITVRLNTQKNILWKLENNDSQIVQQFKGSDTIQQIIAYVRATAKEGQGQKAKIGKHLVIMIENGHFSPSPFETLSNLYDCFAQGEQLSLKIAEEVDYG